jgi:hypothetical protein
MDSLGSVPVHSTKPISDITPFLEYVSTPCISPAAILALPSYYTNGLLHRAYDFLPDLDSGVKCIFSAAR